MRQNCKVKTPPWMTMMIIFLLLKCPLMGMTQDSRHVTFDILSTDQEKQIRTRRPHSSSPGFRLASSKMQSCRSFSDQALIQQMPLLTSSWNKKTRTTTYEGDIRGFYGEDERA